MKIALDVESTLADVQSAFREEYEKRHGVEAEISETWGFDNVDYSKSEFFKITQSLWKNNYLSILPTEDELRTTTRELRDIAGQVDLVTGRQGADQNMKAWAEFVGVVYENFYSVPTQKGKSSLGYDVLIDDSPRHIDAINDDQYLFLYNQPYNQDEALTGESLPHNVTRIDNLSQCIVPITEIRDKDDDFNRV